MKSYLLQLDYDIFDNTFNSVWVSISLFNTGRLLTLRQLLLLVSGLPSTQWYSTLRTVPGTSSSVSNT